MSRWCRRLRGGTFVGNVALVASGTVIGQGIVALASPLLTRFYGPAEFGILGIYAALLALLLSVVSLRYEQAVAVASDDDEAMNVLALCLILALAVSVALTCLIVPFGSAIGRLIDGPEVVPYLWLVPVGLVVAGSAQALSYWAVRQRRFSPITRSSIGQGVSQAGLQSALGAAGAGPGGLVFGDIAGWFVGASFLGWDLRRDRASSSAIHLSRILAVAHRYRRFALLGSWAGLLNGATQQLPLLLIAGFYGPAQAGLFGLSARVVAVPTVLLGKAVSQVYLGEIQQRVREHDGSARSLFVKTARHLFALAVGPMILVALAGPTVFAFVFGSAWATAGEFARILSLMCLAQFVVNPLAWTLALAERQDLQLMWDGARFILALGSVVAAGLIGWDVTTAVLLYGVTMTGMYCVLGWLSLRHLQPNAEVTVDAPA